MRTLEQTIGAGVALLTVLLIYTAKTTAEPSSQTLTTLHTFGSPGDGANPLANVVIGRDGVLYGTTSAGGNANLGTVFSLTPPTSSGGPWTETVLYNFGGSPGDGANPLAGVVIGRDGVLYGTTSTGGNANLGAVFSLRPPASAGGAWTERVLHSFAGSPGDGFNPLAGVLIGNGGVLYGTTEAGGSTFGTGTVFSLTPPVSPGGGWTETILHNFGVSSLDGVSPEASVVIGSGGVLYGTTSGGGTPPFCPGAVPCGTAFSLTPPVSPGGAWTETVLYNFGGLSTGYYLPAGVVIGSAGALYGTTKYGGGTNSGPCATVSDGCGMVFSLTPPGTPGGAWTETVLHKFAGLSDGGYPSAGVVIGHNGVLFGTTDAGSGTVFSLKP